MQKAEDAYTGKVFTSTATFSQYLQNNNGQLPVYVLLNGFIYQLNQSSQYETGTIALHKYARQIMKISLTDLVRVELYRLPLTQEYRLGSIEIELELLGAPADQKKIEIDDEQISQAFRKIYNQQFFKVTQMLIIEQNGIVLIGKVVKTSLMQLGLENVKELQGFKYGGMLIDDTTLEFIAKGQQLKLKSAGTKVNSLFQEGFSFDKMGVGGLDKELANIFRRAFASRRFPTQFLEKYGIKHVKGLLLFGPPGTGKTLIARQLAKVLKAKEPKIINGPEIFSKYVGEAEENIRKQFKEAIEDQESLGEDSPLHILVFDEMDAICKQRGTISSGSAAYDNVVNQLLSMIDGVNSLNNILVIGMTNRKDLIDEAVLRPGRFEVHIEVGLPDEFGRQQILTIHTEKLRQNNAIDKDVNLQELASQMKNYTGAEIEAVVKSASSFAFQRVNSIFDLTKQANLKITTEEFKVDSRDFAQALDEVRPQFGVDNSKFDVLLRQKLIDYGSNYQRLLKVLQNSIEQTRKGKNSQLNSILLEGDVGSGKTSIAAWTAVQCGFPYVKIISAETFLGYTESATVNMIVRIFNDAYKSPMSCIVIDNIERIIEYVDIGPRFSNNILQALLVLIKKIPDKEQNRLFIIGTTSQASILRNLEVMMCFNLTVKVPNLTQADEVQRVLMSGRNKESSLKTAEDISKGITNIPIKRLLMILDMATHGDRELEYNEFMQCYESVELVSY